MTSLFFEVKIIASLNQLASIPLPISKYILGEWMLMLLRKPNNYRLDRIATILLNEGCKANAEQITSTLEHLFLVAKREGLSVKQVGVLLKENTILDDDHTALLVASYERFQGENLSSRIKQADKAELQWSAISLRQTSTGQLCNRLYIKTQTTHVSRGIANTQTATMTLLEFRLLSDQIMRAESLMV